MYALSQAIIKCLSAAGVLGVTTLNDMKSQVAVIGVRMYVMSIVGDTGHVSQAAASVILGVTRLTENSPLISTLLK